METKENGNGENRMKYCEGCEKDYPSQNVLFMDDMTDLCVRCVIQGVNRDKKKAGDTTEFVLIEKPRDKRLGQAIMNAYREQWRPQLYTAEYLKGLWESDKLNEKIYEDFNEFVEDLNTKEHWDIWEQDTEDIQKAIDKIK